MPNIPVINIGGTDYNIKDEAAHTEIDNLKSELSDLYPAIDAADTSTGNLMRMVAEPYRVSDFMALVGQEQVSVSDGSVTFSFNESAVSDRYYGILTMRNYLDFNENALYILSVKHVYSLDTTYALVVNPNRARLSTVTLNETQIRGYDVTYIEGHSLTKGSALKAIEAYCSGENIILNLYGYKNIVPLKDIPVIPNHPENVCGYWELPAFGIVNVAPDSKTVTYGMNSSTLQMITSPDKWFGKKSEHTRNNFSEMNANNPYQAIDWTAIVGVEHVVCGDEKLTFYSDARASSNHYVGMLSNRNYLNFNTNALYILAFARPDWEPNGVAMYINPNTHKLGWVSFDSSVSRNYEVTLDHGDMVKRVIRAYQDNGKIHVNIWGVDNVVDITDYYMNPASSSFGYWSAEDICFGLIFTDGDSQDSPKTLEYKEQNSLVKKTIWYALGDSLTAGSHSEPDGTPVADREAPWSYPQRIADMVGCTIYNLGIPGGSSSLIYSHEVPSVGSDATLITIMTGTNDYSLNSVLGTYDSTDWNTHMGRVHDIVTNLMSTAPGARIVLLTPPMSSGDLDWDDPTVIANGYRRGTPNSATTPWTYDDLVEEYQKFCKKYGIEFINVMWNSPINMFNIKTMLPDKTHPTKEAYGPLAQYIYSQLF